MSLMSNGKPTRTELEQYLAMMLNTSVNMITFVRLEDVPSKWKHSCVQTGVTELRSSQIDIGYTHVEYAVCPYCAKVLYFVESDV